MLDEAKGPWSPAFRFPLWPITCLWEAHRWRRQEFPPTTALLEPVFRGILPLNVEVVHSHHD